MSSVKSAHVQRCRCFNRSPSCTPPDEDAYVPAPASFQLPPPYPHLSAHLHSQQQLHAQHQQQQPAMLHPNNHHGDSHLPPHLLARERCVLPRAQKLSYSQFIKSLCCKQSTRETSSSRNVTRHPDKMHFMPGAGTAPCMRPRQGARPRTAMLSEGPPGAGSARGGRRSCTSTAMRLSACCLGPQRSCLRSVWATGGAIRRVHARNLISLTAFTFPWHALAVYFKLLGLQVWHQVV